MLQIVTWWALFIGAVSLGLGVTEVVRKASGNLRAFRPDLFGLAWLGLAFAIGFLEVASVFLPIGRACMVVLLLLALPSISTAVALLFRAARRSLRRTVVGTLLVAIWIGGVSFVILQGANAPVVQSDTVSTHIQQVMWARDYGSVIGLGILNPKLAFDQSGHLLAALLDHGVFHDRSVRVAVPFFIWLTLVQWVATLFRSTRHAGDVRAKCFCGLTLPFLLIKTQSSEVSSFSGDLSMACVALPTVLALIRLPIVKPGAKIDRLRAMLRRHAYDCMVLGSLGALLITIKLSGMIVSIFALGLFVLSVLAAGRWRYWLSSFVPILLVLGMLARRIVISGWLLYPFPVGNLSLPWSISEADATNEYRWIQSWGRLPDQKPEEVLDQGFFHWFVPWFDKFCKQPELTVCFIAAALLTLRFTSSLRRSIPISMNEAVGTSALFLSCLFWFCGAPDLRFGAVFIWMFAAAVAIPFFAANYLTETTPKILLAAVTALSLAWVSNGWVHLLYAPVSGEVPESAIRWTSNTQPLIVPNLVEPPLTVNVPVAGQSCGDAPLPCVPAIYVKKQQLRRPGDLSSGFVP